MAVFAEKASGTGRKSRPENDALRTEAHDLRRTFVRVAYEPGLSLVNIKHILGHESFDMTARYIGLDETETAAGLQRFTERMARELVAV